MFLLKLKAILFFLVFSAVMQDSETVRSVYLLLCLESISIPFVLLYQINEQISIAYVVLMLLQYISKLVTSNAIYSFFSVNTNSIDIYINQKSRTLALISIFSSNRYNIIECRISFDNESHFSKVTRQYQRTTI